MSSPKESIARQSGWMVVLGPIIAATILRASGIHSKSLWGDEFISLAVSTGHFWYPWNGAETALFYSASYYRGLISLAPTYFSQQLLDVLRLNDQVPFYYVILNLWIHAFGTSEAALRSVSLLAGIASIPLLYALGRHTVSHQVGMYGAWIFALAPFQVTYALYNRPYALLGFFALLSTLAAVHLSRGASGWKWLLVYAIAVILGFYTHYIFVWNLVCHVLLVVFYQWRNWPFLVRFGLTGLAVAGSCLLWAPMLLAQASWSRAIGSNSWFYWYSGVPSVRDTVSYLGRSTLLLLTSGRVSGFCTRLSASEDCRLDQAATVVSYLVPLTLLGACAWRMLQHFARRARANDVTPDAWGLCLLWTSCVLAGPVIMDMVLNTHMVRAHRYVISGSGPVYLAVAMVFAAIRHPVLQRSLSASFLAFLLVGSAFYVRGWSTSLMYEVAARDVAQHLDRRSTGSEDLILVLDPGFNPMDFAYYLRSDPDFARVDVPEWHPSTPDIPTQLHELTRAKARARIWHLDDLGPETRAHAAVLEWLRTHYAEAEMTAFTNVNVFQFIPRGAD
jgi:4-amino-4-deoxy-L-arabinose transferase-like glycosyltransferase